MSGKGNAPWIVGSLLAAILIAAFYLWHKTPPAAAPLGLSKGVRPEAMSIPNAAVKTDRPKSSGAAVHTLEFCGLGNVPIDADDPLAASRYLGGLTSKARSRWLSAMLDSGDLRARAAGLYLEAKLFDDSAAPSSADQPRDALVQLAAGSADPAVYAMAVYACSASSDPAAVGACQRITLNGWASRDNDNAVPWLLVAGKARARNDMTGEAAAFSQAARANRADAYNFSIYAYAESELPTDVTPLERWYLTIEVLGIESATGSLQYGAALKHCSADSMQDRDVREQCGALAELLVDKGTTLGDFGVGIAIGDRAGWAKARVAKLAEERDALMQTGMQVTPTDKDLWTCDGVSRGNAYMGQWARGGEMHAARDLLDRSGETVSALAEKHREFIDKIMRDTLQQQESALPNQSP